MDPSLKLPPVHALFPPFASDRVGLLASSGSVESNYSFMKWSWLFDGRDSASQTFGRSILAVLALEIPASRTFVAGRSWQCL